MGRVEQLDDRLDRGGLVLSLHHGIGHLMSTFQSFQQGVGNLSAGSCLVVVGHCISVERHTRCRATHSALMPLDPTRRPVSQIQEPPIPVLDRTRPRRLGLDDALG